jgi:hypothetical protein
MEITLKPPITTCSKPAGLASAMTPARSGPEGSSWDIASLHGSSEQRDSLLRELLAFFQPLSRRQCQVDLPYVMVSGRIGSGMNSAKVGAYD